MTPAELKAIEERAWGQAWQADFEKLQAYIQELETKLKGLKDLEELAAKNQPCGNCVL